MTFELSTAVDGMGVTTDRRVEHRPPERVSSA
jgi:hypothetical protein